MNLEMEENWIGAPRLNPCPLLSLLTERFGKSMNTYSFNDERIQNRLRELFDEDICSMLRPPLTSQAYR